MNNKFQRFEESSRPCNERPGGDIFKPEGGITLARTVARPSLNPFTLRFRSRAREHAYQTEYTAWLGSQARIAFVLGVAVVILLGLVDLYFAPNQLATLFSYRAGITVLGTIGFLLTFTHSFQHSHQSILTGLGTAAGILLIGMLDYLPQVIVGVYFSSLIILLNWMMFAGIRFIYVTVSGVFLLAVFTVFALLTTKISAMAVVGFNAFLVSALVLSSAANYHLEYSRRIRFMQQMRIDKERRRNAWLAAHDGLTGLINRSEFYRLANAYLGEQKKTDHLGALLVIDLDRFKPINDQYGHVVGDDVLKVVAKRLTRAIREGDTAARMGGDEFAVLLPKITQEKQVRQIVEKLTSSIRAPIVLDRGFDNSLVCHVGLSVGVKSIRGNDKSNLRQLIVAADHAMYMAKEVGGGSMMFLRPDADLASSMEDNDTDELNVIRLRH